MTKKRATILCLNARWWCVCLAACLSAQPLGAGAADTSAVRSYVLFTTHNLALEEIARRVDMVIWHNDPALRAVLPALRQYNPRISALMYRELFCIQRDETPLGETVGEYSWIMEHHPEWFQRDSFGKLVEIPDYPGRFMMDPGNADWQDFWIRRTLRDVRQGTWDGVFVDDVLTSVRMHDLPRLRNYSDDERLQEAMYAFLAKAYRVFQDAGKLMIANVSNSYDYPGLLEKWLLVTDGIMEEHFCGQSWSWGRHVAQSQLEAMQVARAAGKRYLCMTYGDWEDTASMEQSLSVYLIGSYSGALWAYRPYLHDPERFPIMPTWLEDIGQPRGVLGRIGKVWYREFARGVLFVNPTPNPQHVTYHGHTRTIAGLSSFRLMFTRNK